MDHVDLKSRRTAPLWHADKSRVRRDARPFRCADHAAGRFFRPVCQDEELPLAHVEGRISGITTCCSMSRLSRFSPRPMTSPSACAKSAAPRCAPSARSRASSACSTTTRTMSRLWTCWPSCATTTCSWLRTCARPMDCAMRRGDVASASLLENWIDEAERRVWFLFEASRHGEAGRS